MIPFRPRLRCSSLHCASRRLYSISAPPTSTSKPLLVLGIESSADDSSASIVSSQREILSLVTISQHDQNSLHGGIHPLLAQASHNKNIPIAISRCLNEAKVDISEIDAIAYTRGPGMRGCLSIGEMAAKGLAAGTNKRLIGVHHMQAHALTPLLTEPIPPKFPFWILLVSGGHTQLVLAESQDKFKILLDTLDSKIGDVFEKAARLIKLPYSITKSPGAILESFASLSPLSPYDQNPLKPLPIPLTTNESARIKAFSFSGILSSLQRQINPDLRSGRDQSKQEIEVRLSEADQREFSRIFQNATIGHLVLKLQQALTAKDNSTNMNDLGGFVVSGGVASNLFLRKSLKTMLTTMSENEVGDGQGVKLYYPPISLCTDNAAMIAWTGLLRLQSGLFSDPYGLPLRPKWSLEDLYDDVES
ncbi:uncharacterized protein IL334_000796 [Kwoniella shivajii]|uniref:N(6)-L-threonylcarbamoyladenine synthase n=1 Tax=Kwoniella shivajii TaxID=564305 RepID=A0ABZ1CQE1_9TREE|nr:hypothetical protein IL334_000796 [Kwoniella shivajii]